MFGTLRRTVSKAMTALGLRTNPTQTAKRYAGPPVPLRRASVLHGIRGAYGAHMAALSGTSGCRGFIPCPPNWDKQPRVKGQRDHSLKVRSNKRKAR